VLATINGDGRVLPARQLNPDVVRAWREAAQDAPFPAPFLCVAALLAHALVWAPRPSRATLLAPLPATLGFLVLWGLAEQEVARERPMRVHRALGPREAAYLTVAPLGDDRVRLLVSAGEEGDAFLRVLLAHEASGEPPRPSLLWSRDGEVVVLRVANEPLLALDRAGERTGWLPAEAADWPRPEAGAEPVEALQRRSEARMAVTRLVDRHGGFHAR